MTDYIAFDGNTKYNRAKYKPHDKTLVRIVKSTHNAANTAVPSGNVVNLMTIPANSVIVGVWGQVSVDSAAADVELDIGTTNDGGAEWGAKVETNAAAGTVAAAQSILNPHFHAAATTLGLQASNSLEWNTGAYTVIVAYVELDSITSTN